jgi:GrpB-like predicted nucleotidyltransferase (UPF0157 family)
MANSQEERIKFLISEEISIVDYDPLWPGSFDQEASFLRQTLPSNLVVRIEHFGSTSVPGLSSKPIIDMLVEVVSLQKARSQIVPILQTSGYEYLWRPVRGDDPPFYAWFIKRDLSGVRTHHIHMVEHDSELWDRLYFRDYLRSFPDEAARYDELKRSLVRAFPRDRVTYTEKKTDYICSVTQRAKEYFQST